MRGVIGHWSLVIGFAVAIAQPVFADGGAVIAQKVVGTDRVTLFAAPTPLRAGPADLSVMVQDAASGEPRLDRRITVQVREKAGDAAATAQAWVPPCCSMKVATAAVPATRELAQNKLLYAANVVLPASGPHEIVVSLAAPNADPAELIATAVVQPPAPAATAYWPFLIAPPLMIAGFALNQRLRRR